MIKTDMLPTPTKPKGKGKNVVERKGLVWCNGLMGGLDDNLASGREGVAVAYSAKSTAAHQAPDQRSSKSETHAPYDHTTPLGITKYYPLSRCIGHIICFKTYMGGKVMNVFKFVFPF